ncbi:MAG: hypothetical protein JKY30_09680 [Flavobacteriales bacterium]|nr:hypothetical protein [Flavobacteriales bacterium]
MKVTYLIILISCFFFSCGNDISNSEKENLKNDPLKTEVAIPTGGIKIIEPIVDEEVVVLEKNGITLTEIKGQNNSEATIQLNTKQFKEGENYLSFSVSGVQNYFISYLANNYSLSQFKTDVFEVEFLYGNNVFLAFLTDKNGISIKTNKGSVLRNAVLGGVESLFDMKQPHLFYYLPQAETNEPILDFYLVNTAISKNGNKVKVMINESEFMINKWAAYKIDGLKKENNSVRIQLIDENGDLIDGPFNDSGERVLYLVRVL